MSFDVFGTQRFVDRSSTELQLPLHLSKQINEWVIFELNRIYINKNRFNHSWFIA